MDSKYWVKLLLFLSHQYGIGADLFNMMIPMCEVTQSCPTLCNPMDNSLPGSSLHGILQARVLEWVIPTGQEKSETIWNKFCTRGRDL